MLIGPGGVGKGTIARRLVERDPSLWLSRSWTTRARRVSERGDEYTFVDRASFEAAIERGEFLEWAEFHGNLYGSPLPRIDQGQRVLFEIDVQGASSILSLQPDATVILLEPPSSEHLRERLRGRGDTTEHVERRLAASEEEIALGKAVAHHVVVNEDVERTVDEILSILNGPDESVGNPPKESR